jgi:IMP dehydrogenase/GMP reductase
MKQLYDFDDILIEPCELSNINSRKEINVFNKSGFLPIMTAPMDTVIGDENKHLFWNQNILPVLPRIAEPTSDWVNYEYFHSYSLDDFIKIFLHETVNIPKDDKKIYVLIDVANGHMVRLYDAVKDAKKLYGSNIFLMIGNVANPVTFEKYCALGVDSIRIGIGNGNACLTTVQTGIGYPLASLIDDCRVIKTHHSFKTEIVADGGFKKYSDIIKAIALGADYVMLGSILNKCLESSGETHKKRDSTLGGTEKIDQYSEDARKRFDADLELFKVFRGMSTKDVQKSWGKVDLTTSEGIVKKNMVEYTLEGWTKNFKDYLRSAMSYTGTQNLEEFRRYRKFNLISMNSFKRFDK